MTSSTQDATLQARDTGMATNSVHGAIDELQRVLDDLIATMDSSTVEKNYAQERILGTAQMLKAKLNKASRECTSRIELALEKLDSSAKDTAAHDKASHRARLKKLRTSVIQEYFTATKTLSILDAYLLRATGSSVAEEDRPKESPTETRMVKVLLDVASQDFPASVKAALNEIDAGSAKFA